MKTKALLALALALAIGTVQAAWKDGVYETKAKGIAAQVFVRTEIAGGRIASIRVLNHREMPDIAGPAVRRIPAEIIAAQSTKVDAVTHATLTSVAIVEAVEEALALAEQKK